MGFYWVFFWNSLHRYISQPLLSSFLCHHFQSKWSTSTGKSRESEGLPRVPWPFVFSQNSAVFFLCSKQVLVCTESLVSKVPMGLSCLPDTGFESHWTPTHVGPPGFSAHGHHRRHMWIGQWGVCVCVCILCLLCPWACSTALQGFTHRIRVQR